MRSHRRDPVRGGVVAPLEEMSVSSPSVPTAPAAPSAPVECAAEPVVWSARRIDPSTSPALGAALAWSAPLSSRRP